MHQNTASVGISNLQRRYTDIGKAAVDMANELLPLAYGTATHGHGLTLDGTYQTIDNLEAILATAAKEISSRGLTPEDDDIKTFIMIFSVYLGEVFRQEHQGEWLKVHYDELGTSTLCVRSRTPRVIFIEPFTRVQNRLFDGADYDVANYYRAASKLTNAA